MYDVVLTTVGALGVLGGGSGGGFDWTSLLPMAGQAIGTAIGGPVGGQVGSSLGSMGQSYLSKNKSGEKTTYNFNPT